MEFPHGVFLYGCPMFCSENKDWKRADDATLAQLAKVSRPPGVVNSWKCLEKYGKTIGKPWDNDDF